MNPNPESLLEELIGPAAGDSLREDTLRQALGALRRRRAIRARVRRSILVVIPLIMISVAASVYRSGRERDAAPTFVKSPPVTTSPDTVPGPAIQIISDDELFALFPDRAVALIGDKDHQTLVFLDGDSTIRH